MKKLIPALTACLFLLPAGLASASILTLEPGAERLAGVPIATSGTAQVGERTHALAPTAKGLRQKRVLFSWVDVYVAQFLTTDGVSIAGMTPAQAQAQLYDQTAVAISQHFLRTVDNGTLSSSFRATVEANADEASADTVNALLRAIGTLGDAVAGRSLDIVIEKLPDGDDLVTVENTANGTVQNLQRGPDAGLRKLVLALYFGRVPNGDEGLLNLQEQLLAN
jgi:hypothetical protein